MLYHYLHPSAQTSIQPVEGTPSVSGVHPYHQGSLPAVFRMPDDGTRADDKEKEKQHGNSRAVVREELSEGVPDMFRLVLNSDFSDYLRFFMTPRHDEIIQMRNNIRIEKGISGKTLYRAEIVRHNEAVEELRHEIYEFCLNLFHSPVGTHCHVTV
jgi:hypothetical protein